MPIQDEDLATPQTPDGGEVATAEVAENVSEVGTTEDAPLGEAVCHIIGGSEEEGDWLWGIAKRRCDEEDGWPEPKKRAKLEKGGEDSQTIPEDDELGTFDVLDPPLPMESLVTVYEESNSLRQNVDAMVTNVDGFGFTLTPSIDPKSKDFEELIEDKLAETGETPGDEILEREVKEHRRNAAQERRRLKQFFAFCADDSFIELRMTSREDLEVIGNFAWEILRDEDGRLRRFIHVPFYTIRLTKKGELVDVTVRRKVDPFTYAEFKERKRFRRFVQRVGGKTVWFKEFGDPRVMSRKTGEYYENEAELKKLMKDDQEEGPATEMWHYKIRALRGAYGLPRWIGNLLSVRGSRLAEEVNFFYFKNKAIPPMIIFVENGRLQDGAVQKLGDFMRQVKGDTEKFWKVAIIEGESADEARRRGVAWSGRPRFKVEKLSSEQLKDALFQDYDEKNRDKVGEAFRMPRLLRGDVRDFNRATAETAKSFAEEQVFQPERDRFDAAINRTFGPELDMKYWHFKTLSSVVRDPFSLTEMVEKLVKAGVLIPEEGREIAEDIFNREFKTIEEAWVKQPIVLTLAGITKAFPEEESASLPWANESLKNVKKWRDVLGLGAPGENIDLNKTVGRLLEIRGALLRETLLPEDNESD